MSDESLNVVYQAITAVVALAAFVLSLVSLWLWYKTQKSSSKMDAINQAFDAFIELSNRRLEHWEVSHLFEVPETYDRVKERLHRCCSEAGFGRRDEFLIKERACAVSIFTLYEMVLYKWGVAKQYRENHCEEFLKEVLDYLTGRLLKNPRLVYLWSEEGENLQVFFERETKRYYKERVLEGQDKLPMDVTGPHYPGPETNHGESLADQREKVADRV